MNPYTATAEELRAALATEPGKVLQVCCAPVLPDPNDQNKQVPARTDVTLTTEEIVEASRKAPRVALGAARHLLPADVLAEIARMEPAQALYFASDLLPAALVAELREMVAEPEE